MSLKSTNPFFSDRKFQEASVNTSRNSEYIEKMTVSDTINKSFILLALLIASAMITWTMVANGNNVMVFTIGGAIVALISVVIATFKPQYSAYLAPGYAIFEGLFIGGISAIFEASYPGIVTQAVGATFVTFAICFALYKYKIVKVTEKFRGIVIAATLAIATYYLISWLLSMFNVITPVHYGNSMMSIGISVFVIIIAALNLFLDFDNIEKGESLQAPKYMEWFSAMGLMITLVWLYIEFLRLLSKLANRN